MLSRPALLALAALAVFVAAPKAFAQNETLEAPFTASLTVKLTQETQTSGRILSVRFGTKDMIESFQGGLSQPGRRAKPVTRRTVAQDLDERQLFLIVDGTATAIPATSFDVLAVPAGINAEANGFTTRRSDNEITSTTFIQTTSVNIGNLATDAFETTLVG